MKEFEVAKKAIIEAGDAIMNWHEADYDIHQKSINDPVTQADIVSQNVLIDALKVFDYGILSEESVEDYGRMSKQKVWIIDPLDGTKDFIQKTGEFTIIVGLIEDGKPILGMVYRPTTRALYWAISGGGAFCEENGIQRKIHVSNISEFHNSRLLVSRNHLLDTEKIFAKNAGIDNLVICGSAGLKACFIAEGLAEIYVNSSDKTSEWDTCGSELVVREAGGSVTDLRGNELLYNKKHTKNEYGFLMTNGSKHFDILDQLNIIRSV